MDTTSIEFTSSVQKEALINEIKGYLFEYLVGLQLSGKCQRPQLFHNSLGEDFHQRLRDYEQWLRQNDLEILRQLPGYSLGAVENLLPHFEGNLVAVVLVGKNSSAGDNPHWQEGDLIVETDKKVYPVSLKLGRWGSYINTKSGGARSFLKKYFGRFKEAFVLQDVWNEESRQAHQEVSVRLHQMAGLEPCETFGSDWNDAGLPRLPGELPEEMKPVIHSHYHFLASRLHDHLKRIQSEHSEEFSHCLFPLVGMGHRDLIQLVCFYRSGKEGKYGDPEFQIHDYDSIDRELSHLEWCDHNQTAGFELALQGGKRILQIRMKPMNSFTRPSFKVNCSLKNL